MLVSTEQVKNGAIPSKQLLGKKVHKICSRDYCLAQNILRSKRQITVQGATQNIRRSLEHKAESSFSLQTVFTVEQKLNLMGGKGATSGFKVTTIETKNAVLEIYSKRGNDSWAEIVRGRLLNVHDLPAADAIYHQACSVKEATTRV